MNAIFVAGTGTDVGKTFVTTGLLGFLRGSGVLARALKPVSSGYDPQRPEDSDAGALLAAMNLPATAADIADIAPFRYAAPLAPDMAARKEGKRLRLEEIVACCRGRIAASSTPLLIEGVGGVMSPIAEDATGLDLMRALHCPAMLVAGSYLGTLSHALTAVSACLNGGVPLRLIVVNETPESSVELDATCAELRRFVRDIPIVAMRRHGAPQNDALREIARACGFIL